MNPIGIDAPNPRLGWQLRFTERGAAQTSYQIQVAATADALQRHTALIWETGRVASDECAHVPYAGPPLSSGQRCYWRVRAWDEEGRPSDWSAAAFFEMGLLHPSDWKAEWIASGDDTGLMLSQPLPLLRTTFELEKPVRDARVYVTSLGLYDLTLNGSGVTDQVLTPGWTSYDKRLQYQTFDATKLLRAGNNAIGVTLGDGWYRGRMGWEEAPRKPYGRVLALLLQLRVTYEDGSVLVVSSDGTWKSSTSPILASDIYNGESYDAQLEKPGWNLPDYDDQGWVPVRIVDRYRQILVAPAGPPLRRIQELRPVGILHTPAGETVFDLGQNMVGWARLKVRGPAGTTVTLRYAEVLDKAGNLYTANLRAAAATDRYTLRGGGDETFEPHFTYHGFRYVAVAGFPGDPAPESITGIVVHSDLEPTGHWESSSEMLNKLQHNIVWGQKGNFFGVPTDCPQRDERCGWTGDAQVFAQTAAWNFNVAGFFTNWLRDLAADQKKDGAVPSVIPDILTRQATTLDSLAGWGDAAVVVPWTVYLAYDDKRLLEQQYPSMKAWVRYEHSRAPDYIWNRGFQIGDWLAYAAPSGSQEANVYPGASTGTDLAATAYFAHSADLLSRAARALGKTDDAKEYGALFDRIRTAFNREFVTSAGRVGENTQTAYALALQFNLLPDALRAEAARRLAGDVAARENHLTTGFLGTPCLCPALSNNGHLDAAYALVEQDTYPSWLYTVKMGATTMWERWDGIKPDGTFQNPAMNSFNHYAFGAIGAWLYTVAAGINLDPGEPGYKHVLIRPQPGGGLAFVRARLKTLYGTVASAWEARDDGALLVSVSLPPNTYATVVLPSANLGSVTEGGRGLYSDPGVSRARQSGDSVTLQAGAGDYRFLYPSPALTWSLRAGSN